MGGRGRCSPHRGVRPRRGARAPCLAREVGAVEHGRADRAAAAAGLQRADARPGRLRLPAAERLHRAAAGDVRRIMSATISFAALGTTAQLVVADELHVAEAEALMRRRLADIDRAASRYRPDSEIALVEAMRGPRRVSHLLSGAVHTALAAARDTGGIVDPTARPGSPGAWRSVQLDPHRRILDVPADVEIDVGATGKALVADRIARDVWRATVEPVLVNLGGDVACAGPHAWDIGLADDHRASDPDDVVEIRS